MISVTDLARQASRLVSEAAKDGRPRVILRNNNVAAVLVSAVEAERLYALDELVEDLQLWALALARTLTDSGERHDLDDVIVELGIELDDED